MRANARLFSPTMIIITPKQTEINTEALQRQFFPSLDAAKSFFADHQRLCCKQTDHICPKHKNSSYLKVKNYARLIRFFYLEEGLLVSGTTTFMLHDLKFACGCQHRVFPFFIIPYKQYVMPCYWAVEKEREQKSRSEILNMMVENDPLRLILLRLKKLERRFVTVERFSVFNMVTIPEVWDRVFQLSDRPFHFGCPKAVVPKAIKSVSPTSASPPAGTTDKMSSEVKETENYAKTVPKRH